MDFKETLKKIKDFIKLKWARGQIQRLSRITYDVMWNTILLFLVISVIGLFFASGIGAGYFASLVKDEEIRDYDSMKEDIYNYEETSIMHYANDVVIGNVPSELHREEVSLDDVSETLIHAVIATEDEYFNEHKGVVPKAIIRAVVQEALNSDTKTGGSTLTQQLIKNQILTNEVSFDRKAKEILLALRLERFFKKDDILEAYLNIIPYGRESSGNNIAGIQTASQGIFDVNADEVSLPQAAYLAGLPQSPSAYTPFTNKGELKDEEYLKPGVNRMKAVLKRMYDSDFITKEEYEKSLEHDIVADFTKKGKKPYEEHPYLVYEIEKEAKEILKEQLAKDDGYSIKDLDGNEELDQEYDILADRDLRMNGYDIHSTIDKEIYDTMQEVAANYSHYGPDRKDEDGDVHKVQTGGILIENNSGRIISFVGGREYTPDNELNHATKAFRQNGSTMKPLLYAAAMEKGVVQPGSPIADIPTKYSNGKPIKNYANANYGMVSARQALANSYNRPAVKTYMEIVDENPAKEFLDKMQFTKLIEEDHHIESLILGSMDKGVSVKENTNAFAALGNSGKFAEAYLVEKITTHDGDVIYEHETETTDVYTPETSYLTIDMMRDVISGGTGSFLNSQLKHGRVDWAGKTGTTNDYKDAWFVGTNPNVTFGTWIGYDNNEGLDYCPNCSLSYSQRNLKLWAELINSAADVDPDLVATETQFEQPEGIVRQSYCAISGMLPSDLCEKAGLVESDLFNAKFVPTKKDDSLIGGSKRALVVVNGEEILAGPNTPKEFTSGEGRGLAFNPDFLKRNDYDKLSDISMLYPRTNTEAWKKIGTSGSSKNADDDVLKDDGKNPSAPSSISLSGDKLTWSKSGSKDVVGYRVFQSSDADGDFKLIGHTTGSSYSISKSDPAAYLIKAVDYFGLESSGSDKLVIKEKKKDNKEKEKDKEKEKEKDKKKEKEKKKQEENKDQDDKDNKDKEKKEDNEKDKEKEKEKKKDESKDHDD